MIQPEGPSRHSRQIRLAEGSLSQHNPWPQLPMHIMACGIPSHATDSLWRLQEHIQAWTLSHVIRKQNKTSSAILDQSQEGAGLQLTLSCLADCPLDPWGLHCKLHMLKKCCYCSCTPHGDITSISLITGLPVIQEIMYTGVYMCIEALHYTVNYYKQYNVTLIEIIKSTLNTYQNYLPEHISAMCYYSLLLAETFTGIINGSSKNSHKNITRQY